MEMLAAPRVLISGMCSQVGKSIISIGLAVALRKRNVGISACVLGSDLIQALILRRLTRRYIRAIDTSILSEVQALQCLVHAAIGADIIMIEGQRGLYDGHSPGNIKGSDAEFAALAKIPVLLVVDAERFGNSIAALIKGYAGFAQLFSVDGVIANRVSQFEDSKGYDRISFDCALNYFGMQPLLGAIPLQDNIPPVPNGNVTQHSSQAALPLQFFIDAGQLVSQYIDIDQLIKIAESAQPIKIEGLDKQQPFGKRTRIAVSEDNCFNIGFQDNIDLLRHYGAEIKTFSPFADQKLPKNIGAVYLSGAVLDEYAADLEGNDSMRQALRDFAANGGVIYSEGGGTAYLCEEFEIAPTSEKYSGVGIINGKAVLDNKPFVYCDGHLVEDSVLGRAGLKVKGVSTGEWRLTELNRGINTMQLSFGGSDMIGDGFSAGAQIVSTLFFAHWGSNPILAKNLVDAAEIVCRI